MKKVKFLINFPCWVSGNIVLVSTTYRSRINPVSIPYQSRIVLVSSSYRSPIVLASGSGNNTKPIYLGREDDMRMRLSGYLEVGLLRSKTLC